MSDYAQRVIEVPVAGFPSYSVNTLGEVRHNKTGRIKATSPNTQGIHSVIMTLDKENFRRSVAVMVAETFIEKPVTREQLSPINLDGDRSNNAVENLAWRPRWFAVEYHKQFHPGYHPCLTRPIRDVDSGYEYSDSMVAATMHGLLDKDILLSIHNRTIVFPTNQMFEEIDW